MSKKSNKSKKVTFTFVNSVKGKGKRQALYLNDERVLDGKVIGGEEVIKVLCDYGIIDGVCLQCCSDDLDDLVPMQFPASLTKIQVSE